MTRNLCSVVAACTLVAALAACTTTNGRKVDMDGARQIKEGVTSKAEVGRLLGQPYSTNRLADGTENWLWSYSEMTQAGTLSLFGLVGSKGSRTDLKIMFKNDIVTKCSVFASSAEGQRLEGIYGASGAGYGAGGNSSETKCSELKP